MSPLQMSRRLKVGDRVSFRGEPSPGQVYRVRARSDRFVICTRPFNFRRTVIYAILDLERKVRGPDDRVFGNAYETDDDCRARLAELDAGQIEVSHRRWRIVDLDTDRVWRAGE